MTDNGWLDYNLNTKNFEKSFEVPDQGIIKHLKKIFSITRNYGIFKAIKYDFDTTFELWSDLEEGRLGISYKTEDKFAELDEHIHNLFKKKKIA